MRLVQREKLLVMAVVISAVLGMLFRFAVKPALARIETLERVIPEKQLELTNLRAKSKEYIFLHDSLDNLRKHLACQDQPLELLPFLESLMEGCGLADNATAMDRNVLQLDTNYQQTIVEIRLENVTLGRLVDFLSKIEGSSQVLARTKSLYTKRNATNTDLLDSVIQIHSPKLAETPRFKESEPGDFRIDGEL